MASFLRNYIDVMNLRIITRKFALQLRQRCIKMNLVTTDTSDQLLSLTGERSVRAVAIRAGYDPSTLTRQMKSGVKAETVIEIARAYGIPAVTSLVHFGFLTGQEALDVGVNAALASATDEQLAQEILDRVRRQSATTALTAPLEASSSNVTRLDDHRPEVVDDERAVASPPSNDSGEDDGYDA